VRTKGKNDQKFWNFLLASPVVFGAMLVFSTAACRGKTGVSGRKPRQRRCKLSSQKTKVSMVTTLEQVTSVSQLSDVQPTDWAFQALQSLVERYGCIAGYPWHLSRQSGADEIQFAAGVMLVWIVSTS